MAISQDVPIPEVFVLWHPRCPLGEKLAIEILKWLRPGNGLGPEVFYRSLPAPATPGQPPPVLPMPLPGKTTQEDDKPDRARRKVSNLQIVLVLIEENMVADQAWRDWLNRLVDPPASERVMMPVALDTTAFNMPPLIQALNYLRPGGLPLPPGDPMNGPAFADVARSLLKQITEAMCRVLLPRPTDEAQGAQSQTSSVEPPKVKVFLSHAKVDGTGPARRLRDYIYSQTQLAAFFDENDIAFGSGFSRVIRSGLSSSDTAALIAVRSAAYAGRPWCRQEFSAFRQPRKRPAASGDAQCWFIYPSLVVEAMDGGTSSAGMAEFGNSTQIRWTDNVPHLEELIVTTVMRDVMLASFHAALGASLSSRPDQIVINWLPDPTTLLRIPDLRNGTPHDVLYPGRGLSYLELKILDGYFPTIKFISFEEAL